ncbi:glycosyltransferase family 4 protein [Wenxinia saemankumensis]|uniref:Mannosyltransferase n=1 Tax=Wenxinia saemankumensis TaxID=1447782 RepID=A0A1M6AZZ0_9RHOB|nr:glycosyltransferase family 4 protein [Wenxinia saemankumensis]SHI42026.1 mannosyltransferase [Wenxinia saemankumensis]
MRPDPDVIAPSFKRRISGVTSTLVRLVPTQARDIAIAACGPALPPEVPRIPLHRLPFLPRRPRVWHARRNVEMLGGLVLRALGQDLRLLFTSASQRRHTAYTRWLIGRMDRIVATSDRSAAFLTRPATVIRHGIDTDAFRPPPDRAALRRELGLPEGLLVGCYGRIRPSKGTDLFLDAMLDLLPDRPGAHAVVMGGTAPKFARFAADLRARAAASPVADRIHFRPEARPWEMAGWFGALDLYVAPQRHEGFGLTPLEAMACGAAVVATDAGAFDELVVPERTGLIVPRGDAPALKAALSRALDDAPARVAWGAAGPAHVAESFRLEDEAAALNAIYREMLAAAR